jgi:hypothetical protein
VDHAVVNYNAKTGLLLNSMSQVNVTYTTVFFNGINSTTAGDGIYIQVYSGGYKVSVLNSAVHGNYFAGIRVSHGVLLGTLLLTNTSYFGNSTGIVGGFNLFR